MQPFMTPMMMGGAAGPIIDELDNPNANGWSFYSSSNDLGQVATGSRYAGTNTFSGGSCFFSSGYYDPDSGDYTASYFKKQFTGLSSKGHLKFRVCNPNGNVVTVLQTTSSANGEGNSTGLSSVSHTDTGVTGPAGNWFVDVYTFTAIADTAYIVLLALNNGGGGTAAYFDKLEIY